MDKKTIPLILLCVVVLVFWNTIAEYLGLVKPVTQPATTEIVADSTRVATAPPLDQPAQSQADLQMPTSPPEISQSIDSLVPEQVIEITTPQYSLEFTNHGGGLNKILLNQYMYHDSGNVIMAVSTDKVVPDFVAANGQYIGSNQIFTTNQTDFGLSAGDSPRRIEYVHDNGKGGRIIKIYTINSDSYDIGFDISVEGVETFGFEWSYELTWGITPTPTEKDISDDYSFFMAVAMMDEKIEFDDFDDGKMNSAQTGPAQWAGMRTKYFAAVMIPKSNKTEGVFARGVKQEVKINGDDVEVRQFSTALQMKLPPSGTMSDSYTLYIGPLDYKMLKEYDIGLEDMVSLGWEYIIKPFSIGIIWLLPKIYSVVPNYGVVVLIFALLIKIITFPLSRKQAVAMSKMKDLQPKMKSLQEKYKNDAARLNKEMMKLYKETGANPLSGCLPMLPQMPLFFALFTVFKSTIAFRGASFVGWITDLSVPDPLYILPIIMTVSMFFQQKMTMTDPKNKMMIYMMPLIFGYLFMNFPAGLVLYWTGFNILSFAETIYVRSKLTPQNPQVKGG